MSAKIPDAMAFGMAIAAGVWLLAPSVAWFDSGELAAAAVQLGVPHPTGFPLFCLSGHALGRVPLASAALRVHALGLVCAAAAVWMWLGALVPAKPAWRAAAALLVVAVPALALHVRASEVYAPVWLAAAAVVAAWVELPTGQRVWAMAAVAGLGAGVHVEAALLGAIGWMAAVMAARRGGWRPVAGSVLLGGAVAAMAMAYLAVAAWRLPMLSWGDVRTLPALRDHLTAASIRHAFANRMGGGWADLAALGHLLWRDGAFLVAPAVVGAVTAWRTARAAALATLAVVLVDATYSVLVNPMGLRDDQAGLLVLLALVVFAAVGVANLAAATLPSRVAPALTAAVLLAWTVSGLEKRPHWGQSDLAAGARYADALLQRAAPAQLAVTASDHAGSGCAWLQSAEGVRPDVACVPGVFFRDDRQLAQVSAAHNRPLWRKAYAVHQPAQRLQVWLQPEMNTQAVAWQPGLASEDALIGAAVLPGLPWSALRLPVPKADAARTAALGLPDAATRLCAQAAGDRQCAGSPTLADALAADLAVHTAAWARRDPAVAVALGEAAVALSAQPKALHNLAILLVATAPARALGLAEQALQRQPDYLRAHRVAARACLQLVDLGRAADHARAAMASADKAERRLWMEELVAEVAPGQRDKLRQALGLQ